ncbi:MULTISPECIES: CoA pyrophosphatase [Flavobacterium]|uniref:NUDIX hydrolase n=1 Tax=Flavobacterium TaxID=237 RepID=UPI00086F52D2|nr:MULTISPECIES: CoA pyrophosphatase [Flavobacterium]MBN9282837.1 CoA pyrophosphatase [Flavobacterium sp.]ODS82474.1 MAG: coenzyme A pyrophosphatase [Chryseobacterium sp. SCN 40-13]OJV71766.1 MAG: coenzyme A pyrophosphatase [Flavobacterium sp. 40-81]
MDFQDFLKYIPKIEKEKLLASDAHIKMAPLERISTLKEANYVDKNPRRAAVMMLFYPKNNKTHLVLIVRNTYPGVHSSQIAFPGGKVEPEDKNLIQTALRETHEEVGIAPQKIKVIKPFSEIYIPPSNFLVSPFMGISQEELSFVPQLEEVAQIIELPLAMFLDDNIIIEVMMTTSYAQNIKVPAFQIEDHIVWGATAMMMSELKETVKNVI